MSENKPQAAKPSHRVYFVQNEDGERSSWIELGVLFPNKDGGFSIVIDRAPYNGFPEGADRLRLVAQPVSPTTG